MWISQQGRYAGRQEHDARLGVVTAQGEQTGVYADGHQRLLPVAAPGGYRWRPKNGQQVLVLKTGADGEAACIIAQQETQEDDLKPGEAELYGQRCSVRLGEDGTLRLCGMVLVNGTPLESLIASMVQQTLAQQEGS